MKTILVAGFEAGAFDRIAQAFTGQKSKHAVRRVNSLGQLQGLLTPLQGDLLIVNMLLPESSSLEWLAAIADARAALPVLAVGGSQQEDFQEYVKRYPDRYFPQVDYLQEPFSDEALLGAVNLCICETPWGVIGGFSLSTLLQMIHMEKKTCTIRVTSGRREGFLYLRAGVLINARYRRTEGLEAAYQILASESPQAEISGQLHDGTQLIHVSMQELLMEAARLQDEVRSEAVASPEDGAGHVPRSEVGKWPHVSHPAPKNSTARLLLWSCLGVAVLLLAGLAGLLLGRKPQLEVLTTPSAVTVKLDGRVCGETPLHLTLPRVEGLLTLEAPGYRPVIYNLRPRDAKLVFNLEPMPRSPRPAAAGPTEETAP